MQNQTTQVNQAKSTWTGMVPVDDTPAVPVSPWSISTATWPLSGTGGESSPNWDRAGVTSPMT